MKKMMFLAMCAVMLLGTLATGYAEQGDWRDVTRSRIEDSQLRIEQGIEGGTLDLVEGRKLDKELRKILGKIDGMKSDGRLSQDGRDKINRNLDRLDSEVVRKTHN
jgi:hypothetical protein